MLSPPTRRGGEAGYVRTAQGFEVDFHVRHVDGREELIQVCASIDQQDVLARVVRALQDAVTNHPRAALILIALDKPALLNMPAGVMIIAARNWLLQDKVV